MPGQFFDLEHWLRAGGVGDENIDRAELFGDIGDEAIDLLFIPDISSECLGGPAGAANAFNDRFGLIGTGEEVYGHLCSALAEGQRDRCAKARAMRP